VAGTDRSDDGSPTWRTNPNVAHLIFTDHLTTPTPATMTAGLESARREGVHKVRTSALFPRAAEVALSVGFEPIDQLALLHRPVDSSDLEQATRTSRAHVLRAWHHRRAAHVDREAFGPVWGNDARSLADIRNATPVHRARLIRVRRHIAGFAISGAAGDHGYLQRLATEPAYRRRGIAHDLVVDALGWMAHRGLTSATVNTGVENQAALQLYNRLGFEKLDEQLMIAEYRFG